MNIDGKTVFIHFNTNGKITILLLSVTICNLFKSPELPSVTCLKVKNLVTKC
jgi:hypothetical protein